MRKVTQKYFNIPKGVTSGNFILNQKNAHALFFFVLFCSGIFRRRPFWRGLRYLEYTAQ